MGFSLSKFGAPLEPGNGIDLEDLLPEEAEASGFEVSGSSAMFIIFLRAAEFEFILSAALTDILGIMGRGWDTVSVLNENLCVTALTGCLGLRLTGSGNPGESPALLEFAVFLIFTGAVVNGSELVLKLL